MLKAILTDPATQVRFLRFALSGLVVGGVQVGGLALLSRWLPPSVSFVASYALAVLAHYSLNKFWALRSARTDPIRQAGEYALTVTVSFLVNFALFRAVFLAGLSPVWATLVTSPPTTVGVFVVLNRRVFRA